MEDYKFPKTAEKVPQNIGSAAAGNGSKYLAMAAFLAAAAVFLVILFILRNGDANSIAGILFRFSLPVLIALVGVLVIRIQDKVVRKISIWGVVLFLFFSIGSMLTFGLVFIPAFLLMLSAAISDTVSSSRRQAKSLIGHDQQIFESHSKPRRPLELIGGILGLIVAVGLGCVRAFHLLDDPIPFNPLRFREEGFGDLVFILILATPYLAALFSVKLPAGARWPVLLPAAILSLPAILISFSLLGFLFIPAIGFLFAATGRSFTLNRVSGIGEALAIAMTITIIATVFTAGTSLFQNRNDARGWSYKTYPDGHTEWESVPQTQTPGLIGITIRAPNNGNSGGTAVSDIVTATEAATSGGLLLLASIEMGVIGLYIARQRPVEPESVP